VTVGVVVDVGLMVKVDVGAMVKVFVGIVVSVGVSVEVSVAVSVGAMVDVSVGVSVCAWTNPMGKTNRNRLNIKSNLKSLNYFFPSQV